MSRTFDVALEAIAANTAANKTAQVAPPVAAATSLPVFAQSQEKDQSQILPSGAGKSFYIETFGCQMNAHDSEKVSGVLLARGYRAVGTPAQADLVLYNTCSIREKAAHKVFSRLGVWRGVAQEQGKVIGVLGCVAQQEGEEIFERAPWVSLVCGSASYSKLPELLAELESGNRRVM